MSPSIAMGVIIIIVLYVGGNRSPLLKVNIFITYVLVTQFNSNQTNCDRPINNINKVNLKFSGQEKFRNTCLMFIN